MKQTQTIVLSIVPRVASAPPVVNITQYDTSARAFKATIYDDTGVMDLSGVAKVVVAGTKSNGAGFRHEITGGSIDIANASVVWNCTAAMSYNAGRVVCNLELYDANNARLGTAPFHIHVAAAAQPAEVITNAPEFGDIVSQAAIEYLKNKPAIKDISYDVRDSFGRLWGDFNGDGLVNNADLIRLNQYISTTGVSGYAAAVDFNGDGSVTNADLVVFNYLLSIKTERHHIIRTRTTYSDGSTDAMWGVTDLPVSVESSGNTGGGGSGSGTDGVGILSVGFKSTNANGDNVYSINLTDGRSYDVIMPHGPAGGTPQRGVDYWTQADINTIKGYVDDAILGGAW